MKSLITFLPSVAIAFCLVFITQHSAKAGILLEEDGIIDACVANRSGYTRILDPFSSSTHCKFWENPVSWSQNGGGNGLMTTKGETQNLDCPPATNISESVECPNGKIVVGGGCDIGSLVGNLSFVNVIISAFNSSSNNITQGVACNFDCTSGDSIQLTPYAVCLAVDS